eukprot:CAMPEP_0201578470 /NCGR_PEP_ID=MMETSP0190_2-20130828/25348_1 /ASSEMBLY_ACC=CAM_ASM_000263 /TAXON_ID=37353 /ORGANISM="Rosalina sp." /LENGTH=56 /DNA_ID=CAMNT_0048011687 /DNA_START=1301 /DNA_END=1468 /DNA_ORIENTATION=+
MNRAKSQYAVPDMSGNNDDDILKKPSTTDANTNANANANTDANNGNDNNNNDSQPT